MPKKSTTTAGSAFHNIIELLMPTPMLQYRIYYVGSDGHFIKAENVSFESDAEAISEARRLAGDHPIEVWQLDRLVTKIDVSPGSSMPGNLFPRFTSQKKR